ncbi:MAG: extracellular solute-binding protein [Clostridia bacterium]|nr:extracellular solute-binding protein [Clostridia bacterium]
MVRRTIALLVGVCLCLSAWTFSGSNVLAEETTNAENTVMVGNTDKGMPAFYSDVAATYPSENYADSSVGITLENGVTADGLAISCVDGSVLWDETITDITWPVTVPQSGKYVLHVKYQSVGNVGNDMVRALMLDGKTPFYEAESLTFYNAWTDDGEVSVNSIGDQVRPGVVQVKCYQEAYVFDSLGWYAEPLVFYLTAGEHQLTLSYISQSMELAGLVFEPYRLTPSYAEISADYPTETIGTVMQIFQAEDTMTVKNDATIRLESDGDPETYPQSLGYRVFNSIGGWRWRAGNQSVKMEFTVDETGWYQMGFRYKHTWNDGLPTHRTVLLDGAVPFAEMYDYRFNYDQDWQTEVLHSNEGDPYLFYLEAGKHELEMRVTMGEIQPLLQSLYSDLLSISDMLQDINELTGNDPDPNYDYEFFRYIPTLEGDMIQLAEQLEYKNDYLKKISSKTTSLGSNLKSSAEQIRSFIADPFSIAARISQLTQMQSNLGAWYSDIQNQPLLLDEFIIAQPQTKIVHRKSNIFQRLWATLVNFGMSFVKDYDNIAGADVDMGEVEEVLNVWISRGTEWAEIVKEMADEDFTPASKTLININIVPASQLNTGSANALMLSIVSGDAPDVAMGVASNSPVEFAIRDAVVDLSQFADYAQVEDRFLENIMVAYRYQNGVFALPETMNFSALFYRTDIFEKYSLKLPDTRQELYDTLLPALYQLGLEYYQPADYLPFLLQRNGSYYTEDGMRSALDTGKRFWHLKNTLKCLLITARRSARISLTVFEPVKCLLVSEDIPCIFSWQQRLLNCLDDGLLLPCPVWSSRMAV